MRPSYSRAWFPAASRDSLQPSCCSLSAGWQRAGRRWLVEAAARVSWHVSMTATARPLPIPWRRSPMPKGRTHLVVCQLLLAPTRAETGLLCMAETTDKRSSARFSGTAIRDQTFQREHLEENCPETPHLPLCHTFLASPIHLHLAEERKLSQEHNS